MPKIHSYPPMTSPDGDDVVPIDDVSASNETKKLSLTKLKEWLQSLVGWITTAMIADSAITPAKRTGGFKVVQFTTTANGAKVVTGVGFQPKSLLVIEYDSIHQSASVANFMMGFTDGSTSGSIGFRAQEAGDISGQIRNTPAFLPGSGQASNNNLAFTSFDSDGFTLTLTNYTSNMNWLVLAFA